MEFRRSGASDERRRRVLRDEITGGQDEDAASIPISSKRDRARRYTDGALAENHPRVTDFLPQRAFAAVVLTLLLLTGVAAVLTAYIVLATTGLLASEPRLALFDLNGRGNVGQWFASLLFGGLAMLSLVIYRIRLHRIDDFRGRYRVWLIASGLFLFLSLDVATQLHQALSAGMEFFSKGPVLGSRDGWWLLLYTAVLGAFAIRLAIEMRANRTALTLVCVGCGLCFISGLQVLGAFSAADPLERTVARVCCGFLGQWALAVSVIVYARHVFLDAQGLLREGEPRKKKTRTKAKEAAAESADDKTSDKDKKSSSTAKPAAAVAKATIAAASAADDDGDEDEDDLSNDRQLSRSERKRLKKSQQQTSAGPQRRAA